MLYKIKFILSICLLYIVQSSAQPIITIDSVLDANCNASADGAIYISVAGSPAFTYLWSNGATTEDITGLFSNSYMVTVTDAFGASTVSGVITVNAPTVLSVNTDSVVAITCFGANDGEAYVDVSGGTLPYTYLWDNGSTTEDITGLGPGAVNLTVTDGNGCTSSSKSIFIDSVPPINLNIDLIQDLTCNNQNDGSIDISVSGGVGNFNYLWSNGATTEDISGLSIGNYTVTATDSNSCTLSSAIITITQPTAVQVNLDSINNINCYGDSSGAIYVQSSGGTGPYAYQWSNGATTEDVNNLILGSYFITVTDANNCSLSAGNFDVVQPDSLEIVLDTFAGPVCAGDANGFIETSVTGGLASYSFSWSNGATSQDINTLYSGIYELTVTDQNGCETLLDSVVLDSVSPLQLLVDSSFDVSCNGYNDGAIFITVSGGSGNYQYLWSNATSIEDPIALGPNNYTVTITDSSGCSLNSGLININEPSPLVINIDSITDVDCYSNMNGSIAVTVSGANLPYAFSWSNGDITEDLNAISGGTYQLIVTDSSLCTDSISAILVNEPDSLNINLDSSSAVSCNGANNAFIAISINGGTAAYSYNWSNGATFEDLSALPGGNYQLTLTDANNCVIISDTFFVAEPLELILMLDSISDVDCNANANGSIDVSTSGGTLAYTYLWSNGTSAEDLNALSGGNYSLTVTDANNCTDTLQNLNLIEPASIVIVLDSVNDVSCNGISDGFIQINSSGGTGMLQFLWSNSDTIQSITNLSGAFYGITVTDENGCTQNLDSILVFEPSALSLQLDSLRNESCTGTTDGYIGVSISGGMVSYTYLWSNGATTNTIATLSADTFMIMVTDSNLCMLQDTFIITDVPTIEITNLQLDSITCYGLSDGAINYNTILGNPGYSWLWSNGSSTEGIQNLSSGTYTVTITDALGCEITRGPFNVTQPDSLIIILDSTIQVSCNGNLDGSIDVSISGGNSPYLFNWNSGESTEDLSSLSGGSYALTVTDQNNCLAFLDSVQIQEADPLNLNLDDLNDLSCYATADGAINLSLSGGVQPYSYVWNNGESTLNLNGLSAGTYQLSVTDSSGCTLISSSFVLSEPDSLEVTINVIELYESCFGAPTGSMEAFVNGGTSAYVFNWSNGASDALNDQLYAGNYGLTVTDLNACTATATADILLPLQPEAYPYFEWAGNQDTSINWNEFLNLGILNDQSAQGVSYLWTVQEPLINLADMNDPYTSIQPQPESTTMYALLLSATSSEGCTDTASIYVLVKVDELIGVPDAFTPNEDGINDFFRPIGIDEQFVKTFMIFDRWGEKLYDGTSFDEQWDGKYRGVDQPSEVYIYLLEYQMPGDPVKYMKGEFTLIR